MEIAAEQEFAYNFMWGGLSMPYNGIGLAVAVFDKLISYYWINIYGLVNHFTINNY